MDFQTVEVPGAPPLPPSLPDLWEVLGPGEAERPALRYRDGESWRRESYQELRDAVRELAAGLVATGIEPGDRVALFADTGPWWTKADLAIASVGAVSVPIYPTSTANQIEWVLEDSEARRCLCDSAERFRTVAAGAGTERAIEIAAADSETSLLAIGRAASDAHSAEAGRRAGAVAGDDLATIIYTSGTTGNPKGCCISHANLIAILGMNLATEGIAAGRPAHRERTYVFLPLAHVAPRMHQYISIAVRGELTYGSGNVGAVFTEAAAVRPTCLPGVPRLFEKVAKLATAGAESDEEAGRAARELLGGQVSWAISGGAPIEPGLVERLLGWGIPVYEGYGMSESSGAIAISARGAHRPGSVGRPLPGVDLRIGETGEIEVSGPNVFGGYWRNPEETAAGLKDGWLRTGDLGRLDDDGFLHVLGRSKDLIATSYGKKVAPAPIENQIRHSPLVSEAIVCGEGRPFLVALIGIDARAAKGMEPARVEELIGRRIAEVNHLYAPPERVRRWAVLPRTLSVAEGELTASMKVRRASVAQNFASLLDEVIAGEAGHGADPRPSQSPA